MDIFNWTEIICSWTVLYTTIAVILLSAIYYHVQNRGIPPGPIGLPYFGYWPFLKNATCHLQLHEFRKQYGDVFSFIATGRLYINLGSIKANREAFVLKSDCFTERITEYSMVNRLFKGSLLTIGGEAWQVNRKFFGQQFKERGMSSLKEELCGPIYDAIQETVKELQEKEGAPIDVIQLLVNRCTDTLFHTCLGANGVTRQELTDYLAAYGGAAENITGPSMLPCGTFAKYFVFPFIGSFQNIQKHVADMERILLSIIERHRSTFEENNIRNIIDAYHKEKLERLSRNDPTSYYFKDEILIGSLIQFIGDGVLGVAGIVGAFLGALVVHLEDQDAIYKELVEVIGPDRDPSIEDRSRLPYTNAFISEMLRTSDIFPFFPKMKCTRDVTINGYRIPRGAHILVNIWSSHHDPDVYEEPDKFKPSRFLPAEGKKKAEQPMLFGIGKHSCLGENFTMVQVFLYMTTLLKHFRLEAPDDSKDKSLLFLQGQMMVSAKLRKNS